MSQSSYLDNSMRFGQIVHNARINLSSNSVSLSAYDGSAFKVVDPLLVRFSSASDAVVSSGLPTHDFTTASWGLPNDDGYWDINVGIQKIGGSSIQVVFGLSREPGSVASVLNASASDIYSVVAPTPTLGDVVWIATIHDVLRVGGSWSTANSYVEEK